MRQTSNLSEYAFKSPYQNRSLFEIGSFLPASMIPERLNFASRVLQEVWGDAAVSIPGPLLFIGWGFIFQFVAYWAYSFLFYLLDTFKPWPLYGFKIQKNVIVSQAKMAEAFQLVMFNMVVVTFPWLCGTYFFRIWWAGDVGNREMLPQLGEIIPQVAVGAVMADICAYYTHYILVCRLRFSLSNFASSIIARSTVEFTKFITTSLPQLPWPLDTVIHWNTSSSICGTSHCLQSSLRCKSSSLNSVP
jgi:hypothetical protein